jgi:hypothetical protein
MTDIRWCRRSLLRKLSPSEVADFGALVAVQAHEYCRLTFAEHVDVHLVSVSALRKLTSPELHYCDLTHLSPTHVRCSPSLSSLALAEPRPARSSCAPRIAHAAPNWPICACFAPPGHSTISESNVMRTEPSVVPPVLFFATFWNRYILL